MLSRWEDFDMADLYQCTRCQQPFVAPDDELIARRSGLCAECTTIDFLRRLGLPADFLTRRLGPA
jgi:hypothetical protein